MLDQIMNFTLDMPITEIFLNQHLKIDGGDIACTLDEQTGHGTYTVCVEHTLKTVDGILYIVMYEDGQQFLIPQKNIVSMSFVS